MRKKTWSWMLLSFLSFSIFAGCIGPTTDPSPLTSVQTQVMTAASTSAPAKTAATKPPVTASAMTQPALTAAPETQPPATAAPETQPPATAAPVTQPPDTAVPVTQPPATAAPATKPSAGDPIPAGAQLKVHFLDVGQGDAIFIQLPNARTMLIDAGENDDGRRILSYLDKLNVRKLDYVVATHPHADHIGGMQDIIEGLPIGEFYMPDAFNTTKTFEGMVDALLLKKIKTRIAHSGVSIVSGNGLKVQIIAPDSAAGSNLNDWSAVIKLTYRNSSFLFVGDAEKPALAELSNVDVDVLKVGHHGSDTSSPLTFLKKVSPDYAVISVGEDNQYGHPANVTLKNLKTVGAKTYRTDKSGNIIVSTDGRTIRVNKSPSAYSGLTRSGTNKAVVKPAPKPPAAVIPKSGSSQQVVYITKTGAKFPLSFCRSLRQSKIKTTRGKAEARGLTPCKICEP